MNKRSLTAFGLSALSLLAFATLLTSCGKNFYFAGRTLPPSGVLNRVLIAEQNPSGFSKGALPFVDAFYDIRHAYNTNLGAFSIAGYAGSLPLTIQNMPEEQVGGIASADGQFVIVSYAQEKTGSALKLPPGTSSSIFVDRARQFVYAANSSLHVLVVADLVHNTSYVLNLPNVYSVSVNPGGTIALAFVRNSTQGANTQIGGGTPSDSFSVYSIVGLTLDQQQAAAHAVDPQHYLNAQDCEPQNLPNFCIFPVSTGANASFDNPVKAVFSPDGSAAYVLNCGPECGGATASATVIPITASTLNGNTSGAKGIALVADHNISIPGGATNAIFNGNTLYVAGQQFQPDHLFQGFLTVLDSRSGQISGTYPISDGTHNKMVFGDDNTLWIGSSRCTSGETYKNAQATGGSQYGCLTMFNTSTNAVKLDSYKGDATGIAPVTGLNKVYTAEGGQVYIYNTADMTERDNSNVTVSGTASDVAYMDATSDDNNTTY